MNDLNEMKGKIIKVVVEYENTPIVFEGTYLALLREKFGSVLEIAG